jgi:hypothetical protein
MGQGPVIAPIGQWHGDDMWASQALLYDESWLTFSSSMTKVGSILQFSVMKIGSTRFLYDTT